MLTNEQINLLRRLIEVENASIDDAARALCMSKNTLYLRMAQAQIQIVRRLEDSRRVIVSAKESIAAV